MTTTPCRVSLDEAKHDLQSEDLELDRDAAYEAIESNLDYVAQAFVESKELRECFLQLLSVVAVNKQDLDAWPLKKIKEMTNAGRELQNKAFDYICNEIMGANLDDY
jgi:hypothetical protein